MVFIGRFTATRVIIVVQSHLYTAHMAADVKLLVWLAGLVNVVLWVLLAATTSIALLFISIIGCRLRGRRFAAGVLAAGLENDRVHAVNWSLRLVLSGEEFLASHGTSNDVTDQRVPLGQVCSKIHLLPIRQIQYVKL